MSIGIDKVKELAEQRGLEITSIDGNLCIMYNKKEEYCVCLDTERTPLISIMLLVSQKIWYNLRLKQALRTEKPLQDWFLCSSKDDRLQDGLG